MPNSLSTWIALGSAAAALSAAAAVIVGFFIYRSNRIAKRSLQLSEEQAQARKPQLVPYLIDGFVRAAVEGGGRIYAFSVLLSNRADTNNALATIELAITYSRRDDTQGILLLPHNRELVEDIGLGDASPFNLPERLSAHDTIAGWAIFELDDSLSEDVDVEGYQIRFVDSHRIECSLEPVILREIVDEPAVASR